MGKTVEFKFDLDQKVTTTFGVKGIVTMLGVDDDGNQYFVATGKSTGWYKENLLEPRDD